MGSTERKPHNEEHRGKETNRNGAHTWPPGSEVHGRSPSKLADLGFVLRGI